MAAYLTVHPPARDQWYHRRNRSLTGCTVLHTTESIFDEMGEDTGAENVARFIRGRSTPGSYHDLVDSDSEIYLVDYSHGAYHDGTGSNNWATAIAFACRTIDWRRMDPAKRKSMLRNGARAFARQQAYRRSVGAPLTELRLITKAQSDAGMSGFTYHGFRDPGRRTDPGTAPPDLFPFDEFIEECAIALGVIDEPETDVQEDTDMLIVVVNPKPDVYVPHVIAGDRYFALKSDVTRQRMQKAGIPQITVGEEEHRNFYAALRSEQATLELPSAPAEPTED